MHREVTRPKITHYALPDKIDAVLKMSFVHFRDGLLVLQYLRKIRPMVVPPTPEKAVKLMCTYSHRDITTPCNFGKFGSGLQSIAPVDKYKVLFCGADDAIFFYRIPCFDRLLLWWAFKRRLVPERAVEACLYERRRCKLFAHRRYGINRVSCSAGYTLCDVRDHTVIVEELMAARLQRLTRPQPQGQSANDHQAYCMSKPVKYLVS
jgi:hypothetical protein